MQEIPVAQLVALTANINRDSKRRPKPFGLSDFLIYQSKPETEGLSPAAAMAALSLRKEGRLPDVMIGVWSEILQAASQGQRMPANRALISACGRVALLAAEPEGSNWRGLLAVNEYPRGGLIELVHVDKPMLKYQVQLPAASASRFVSDQHLIYGAAT
jgi:hypothetical protein